MGGFSVTHWLVVALIVLIVFGAGKLPRLMGDLATGIKSFKGNLKDDDTLETPVAASARAADERTPAESRLG